MVDISIAVASTSYWLWTHVMVRAGEMWAASVWSGECTGNCKGPSRSKGKDSAVRKVRERCCASHLWCLNQIR